MKLQKGRQFWVRSVGFQSPRTTGFRCACAGLLPQVFLREGEERANIAERNVNESNQNEVRRSLMVGLPNQTLIDVGTCSDRCYSPCHHCRHQRRDLRGLRRSLRQGLLAQQAVGQLEQNRTSRSIVAYVWGVH
jgi:hypothetical protein